jgi:ATP-binding cassette subfamily B protein
MIVQGTFTTGQLLGLLTYTMMILMSLMVLSMIFVMLTMSRASIKRISEVLYATNDMMISSPVLNK